MILAVDVQYTNNQAFVSAITFNDWGAKEPINEYETTLNKVEKYVPGQFYKRELPCILKLLNEYNLSPDVIVIDGYVYLDDFKKPGLGMHLYNALEGKSNIIGVAKSEFSGTSEGQKIYRGKSKIPLFVTAVGIDISSAKENILRMSGSNRVPTLLKHVDRLCRQKASKANKSINRAQNMSAD